MTVGAVVVAFLLFGRAFRSIVSGDFDIGAVGSIMGAFALVAVRSV